MKPGSVTDPEDIKRHVAKFKRRAKFLTEPEIAKVLQRFPERQREAIFNDVVKALPFEATFPTSEQFRKASLNAHQVAAEVRADKEREERERKERETPPKPDPPKEPPPRPVTPKRSRAK